MYTDPAPDDQTLLDALRHTGLRLVSAIDASLDADRTPDELDHLAKTYERTGRGIRRTIAFCHHLAKPARDPAKHAAARRQVIRAVEDAIERSETRADPESLRSELYERLETTEFDEDLDHLTPDQAVEHILQDFGLANTPFYPPFPRRTPAQIATLAARAAGQSVPDQPQPGNPYDQANPTVEAILAWDARKRARARSP